MSLLLVLGSVKFFNLETTQHQEYYKIQQRDFQRAIQEDYPYNKAFYDSLYLAVTGSTETLPDNVSLSKKQIKQLADKQPSINWIYPPLRSHEWPVLWGLLLLGVFLALVGYPIYRAVGKYKEENIRAFYGWLLLPMGVAALALWGAFAILTQNYSGDNTIKLLDAFAGIALIGILLWKTWQYLKNRKFLTLLVYALPASWIMLMLVPASDGVFLAWRRRLFLGGRPTCGDLSGNHSSFSAGGLGHGSGALCFLGG
ncbi:MAG: hypothetical protein IPJ40_02980 [Saprospirales bacterium]|nr:hypothetical protein [Saprospirales bacterium]